MNVFTRQSNVYAFTFNRYIVRQKKIKNNGKKVNRSQHAKASLGRWKKLYSGFDKRHSRNSSFWLCAQLHNRRLARLQIMLKNLRLKKICSVDVYLLMYI